MENTKLSFKGHSIYIGIDVHLKSWKVCILIEDTNHKTACFPPSAKKLSGYLRHNFPDANYYSVYEAGYSGYWIHEELERNGIKNIIVNPADIPTKDKEKRIKTDRIDCSKLARCLRNGELDSIYIRNKPQQEDRSLVRMKHMMTKKKARCKTQIKSKLSFYGIVPEDEVLQSYWSKNYINWIESKIEGMESAKIAIKALLQELKDLRKNILEIIREIRRLSQKEQYAENVRLLQSIPGISVLSAMTILTEIGDINNFQGLDKLISFIGLIPSEHSSGEREYKGEMLHRGSKILKRIMVESSWVAVRKDPSLMLSFMNYTKDRKAKQKAIIKIARKLVNRIRYVLINKKEYQLSVV